MKVLGSYMVGSQEQRTLVAGATIDLPRDRILSRAEIGDLIWVKEAWAMYVSRGSLHQIIRQAVPGPANTLPPAYIRQVPCKISPQSALTLERVDSRCTLEVMAINEHVVRMLVHMQQVDEFLESRAKCA